MTIEKKLEDLGLVLPDLKPPLGAYVPYLERDGLVFISGQGPVLAGGGAICGRLGDGLDIEDGARAAQLSALNILAQIRAAVGSDWQKLVRIVRLCGYVNATPDFTHHPAVVNGAS
ncbi:MAG: RidA family protein, partial [Pseudomonadota bacterium]|nr:RidA family protein [Pseudomonadota bacterium]